MVMKWDPDSSIWGDFLELDPLGRRANYFSRQDQFGKSPNQRKWFEDQFQNVQDKYLGSLGSAIRGGGSPTQSLSSYLDNYFSQGGGAQQDWFGMAPSQRGVRDSQYAPSVRWNV